ncbi:energy-coupling factor transporter ATP-binding protein EcfA1 [Marinithermofilum abyssi]|uniref:Energy-coupling factor transporter ATP-binding protein EcfA1 n=1 Tax=Marinithermofilum abyssi TaxID=1571185 RepID=A0A8J2VI63_9BACL|nr:energy-coupling factor transporter ATP-binding protein EcfA1 [Marinithermofilum abyssi]
MFYHYFPEKTPRSQWALQGVNLRIDPGEYVAVMGPNGSGKSTLAKLLNGLLLPTEGCVRVMGKDTRNAEDLWEIRRQVGMVFQNPDNQIVGATVRDDVAFGMENLGVPRAEMLRRIPEVLSQMGLAGREEDSPHHLSGGQKQRLAIAGILAMKPAVILFDESTSMLDPAGRDDVMQAIQDLHRQGTTVVHITHSAREASLADRLVVMAEGRVQMQGAPGEVFRQGERLRDWDLEPPLIYRLQEQLQKQGMPLTGTASDTKELVNELWGLLSKG